MGLARRVPELDRCPECGGDACSVGARGWCLARVDEGGCGATFARVYLGSYLPGREPWREVWEWREVSRPACSSAVA